MHKSKSLLSFGCFECNSVKHSLTCKASSLGFIPPGRRSFSNSQLGAIAFSLLLSSSYCPDMTNAVEKDVKLQAIHPFIQICSFKDVLSLSLSEFAAKMAQSNVLEKLE